MEYCVEAAGVGATLIALILLGGFYAFPMCLVSTELSCMMPTNHGSIVWAYRSFYNFSPKIADFIGFINALNQMLIYAVGLSFAPIIFVGYFQTITGDLSSGYEYLVMLAVIISAGIVNIFNVKIMGTIVSFLFIFAVGSFLVGFFASLPDIKYSQWTQQCSNYDFAFFMAIFVCPSMRLLFAIRLYVVSAVNELVSNKQKHKH